MSRESLKTIADKDQWTWEDHCRAHAYNTGEDLMIYKRGCIHCGWFTFNSPIPDPICPDCGHHIAAGPSNPASPTEIKQAQEALERVMSMEKRGVVKTEAEKTAADKIAKDAKKNKDTTKHKTGKAAETEKK